MLFVSPTGIKSWAYSIQVFMSYLKRILVGTGSGASSGSQVGGVGLTKCLIAGLLQCIGGIVIVETKRKIKPK